MNVVSTVPYPISLCHVRRATARSQQAYWVHMHPHLKKKMQKIQMDFTYFTDANWFHIGKTYERPGSFACLGPARVLLVPRPLVSLSRIPQWQSLDTALHSMYRRVSGNSISIHRSELYTTCTCRGIPILT